MLNVFFTYHNVFTHYLDIANYNKTFQLVDFKSKIDGVLLLPSWPFLHSLPFHQLSPHKHNKGSHLILDIRVLLPVMY